MTPFTVELLVNAVFILLFAINIFIGYRRGFVKTFFSFVTFAASFFISFIFAKPMASLLKNTSLYTGIFSRLKSTLLSYLEGLSPEQLNAAFSPEAQQASQQAADQGTVYLKGYGRSLADVSDEYAHIAIEKSEQAAESIAEYIIEPACDMIITGLSFILIFILSFIALRIVAFTLNLAAKAPVLNSFNRFTGALAGFLIAFIQAVLLTVVCDALLPYFDLSHLGITAATLRHSYLYGLFAGITPVGAAFVK